MLKSKVFVTAPLPGDGMKRLAQSTDVSIHKGEIPITYDNLLKGAKDANALICQLTDPIDEGLLQHCPALKVVSTCSVGFNHINLDACRRRGIVVTHTPGILTDATADLTFALILAIVRRIAEGDRLVRSGGFTGWRHDLLLGGDLVGKNLGIAGFGRIGRAVAQRGRGFGMKIIYCDPVSAPKEVEEALGATKVNKETLLAQSDVLSLHLNLTAATEHFIDGQALKRMKSGAYLVNTSRGAIVDEAALVQALSEGALRGGALDVFENEPKVHPGLLELDNVVLCPHLGSASTQTRTAMADMVAEDVRLILSGNKAKWVVAELR